MKRVVAIADLHSGHLLGLTPPDFNPKFRKGTAGYDLMLKRRILWDFYAETCQQLQPVDALIVNGDAIEGKGEKSGGTELIAIDRNEQVDMAIAAILEMKAKDILMAFGTPYHAGVTEDFEVNIAKGVNARKIGGHDWLRTPKGTGPVIDYRHFVSRSSIPHGRWTPLGRERLINLLWAEHGEYPKARIILRAHVHYHVDCGEGNDWRAIILPALTLPGGKLGSRIMSSVVHTGVVWFDIEDEENWSWHSKLLRLRQATKHIMEL